MLLSDLKVLTRLTGMAEADRTPSERAEEVREGLTLLADYL